MNIDVQNYHFFLDETGDHGLVFVDENFPIFLLAGCLFGDAEYQRVENEIDEFKEEFFGTKGVILHSREIRKCEGAFQILFDLDTKRRFYERLNQIISEAQFSIIAVAIDKKKYIEKYGDIADNPYTICLSYILERVIFCTDGGSTGSQVQIIIEKRGKNEDRQVLSHYNRIMDSGTYHVTANRFKNRIRGFSMMMKRDNNIGLQIADLCAYPVARHVLNAEEPYIPFKIIESKLRKNGRGEVDGYGLKIFP